MEHCRWSVVGWVLACGLSACVMPEPVPDAPPPPLQSAPAAAPTASEDSLPTPRAVLNLPKPTPTPVPAPAVQAKPVATPAQHGAKADEKTAETPEAVPRTDDKLSQNRVRLGVVPAQMLAEFPWLQRCVRRAVYGGAVQCDANVLLAGPSSRVQVFVRDPALARSTADGLRIQVREGLPELYRFFVVP